VLKIQNKILNLLKSPLLKKEENNVINDGTFNVSHVIYDDSIIFYQTICIFMISKYQKRWQPFPIPSSDTFFARNFPRRHKFQRVSSIVFQNESRFVATASLYLNGPHIRAQQSQIAEIRARSTSRNRGILPRGKFSTTVVMDPRPMPAGHPSTRGREMKRFRENFARRSIERSLNWTKLVAYVVIFSLIIWLYLKKKT